MSAGPQSTKAAVAFVGDSITAAGRWDQLFPKVDARNFGIDGECSQDILNRLQPIVEVAPSKLFLMIGTNDLGRGIPEQVIVANVEKILDSLAAALGGCHLYLQTVLPREAMFVDKVRSLNRRYADLARSRNTTMIDLFPIFADQHGALRGDLTDDGLHLLQSSYLLWQKAIERFV